MHTGSWCAAAVARAVWQAACCLLCCSCSLTRPPAATCGPCLRRFRRHHCKHICAVLSGLSILDQPAGVSGTCLVHAGRY